LGSGRSIYNYVVFIIRIIIVCNHKNVIVHIAKFELHHDKYFAICTKSDCTVKQKKMLICYMVFTGSEFSYIFYIHTHILRLLYETVFMFVLKRLNHFFGTYFLECLS
jgi:hypothetical protein